MPAKSKQQQKFFGVVRAMQKGDIPKKGEAGEVADDMKNKDIKDMASTKHKGLPKKVKEIIAQEIIKELQLNEVKPIIDPKLKSKPTDRIQYVATNDNRYPTEIVFIDTKTGHVVFFNIQEKEVERISWNKLSSTHWVRPYLEKEFEGFLDGWSPSGKIKYKNESKLNELKTGNKINKARAKAHFKQGEKIAVVHKATKNAMPIEDIKQIDAFDTKEYDFAYITESKKKLNELSGWWSGDKKNLMSYTYWLKGQLPPTNKAQYQKEWESLVQQLQKKHPAPSAEYRKKLNEAPVDMNDPFLVQTRIMKAAAKDMKLLDAMSKGTFPRKYKISFDKYLELLDTQMFFQQDMAELAKQLKQTNTDMEQEAGQKGDDWTDDDANRYGRELNKLEDEYKKVKAKLDKVDARVGKYAMY